LVPALGVPITILTIELLLLPMLGPQSGAVRRPAGGGRSVAASASVWVLAILVMLYAGTENGITAWSTATISLGAGVERASAALVTSAFWVALTSGRLALVLFGFRLRPQRILLLCLAGALCGGVLLFAVQSNVALATLAFVVIGFCFGPVFPTSVALANGLFPASPGVVTSIVISSASFGSILIPWWQGVLLDRGGPSASVMLTLVAQLVMLAFVLTGLRLVGRTSPAT
jgi:fucose permease